MIDWVFFDVGNVMFNDDPQACFAYRHTFEAIRAVRPDYTFAEMLSERERRAAAGENWIINKIAADALAEPRRAAVFAELDERLIADYDRNHLPNDGLHQIVARLRGRFRLGVIANQPSDCRRSLERRGLLEAFEVVGISDELDLHKPDPELYRWAVGRAGCDPARAVMIGDRRDNDVGPAKSVGLRTVHVVWPGSAEKNWRPSHEHERDFLASVDRVPLFSGRFGGPDPDRTAASLWDVAEAVESLAGPE